MPPFRRILRRLSRLIRIRRSDEEMDEEMRHHLEERMADLAETGVPAGQLLHEAQRRFGNTTSLQEQARDARTWRWPLDLARDVRFSLRQLGRSPGFTLVAILTLALGIGANTAIFSLVNSTTLRALPFPDPDRLVQIWTRDPHIGLYPVVSGPRFAQWRDHATKADVAGYCEISLNLIEDGSAENVRGAEISTNYLDVLGVRTWRGRGFQPADAAAGDAGRVIIITYEWWQGRLGGDLSILDRTINLHLRPYAVVGILPPQALLSDSVSFLVPMVLEEAPWRMAPLVPWMTAIARIHPDATQAGARGELDALTSEVDRRLNPESVFPGHEFSPLQTLLLGQSPPPLAILLGAVAVVLLIVCVNLANLLLVRGAARHKEVAVRLALGASAGRLVRQMLTESLVLALAGGFVGAWMANAGVGLLDQVLGGDLPAMLRPVIDWRVLTFTLAVVLATSVLFGLAPALQTRHVDVQGALKEEGWNPVSWSGARVQSLLIVAEIALTVMLLIGAGLLGRSFARITEAETGFESHGVLTCDVALTTSKLADDDAAFRVQREMLDAIRQVPGVTQAGSSTTLPLTRDRWGGSVARTGTPEGAGDVRVGRDFVGGDYFTAMGMTLIRGRWLNDADQSLDAPRVVVLSQSLADALYPGENPVGGYVRMDNLDWEIAGMAADVRYRQLDEAPEPRIYAPHVHKPWTLRLVVRTALPPSGLVSSLRQAAASVDPDHALSNFRTLEDAVDHSLLRRRGALVLVGAFASVALALAALGVYGVIAFAIARHEREIAIRIALGAERRTIVGFVFRQGIGPVLAGILLGVAGGFIGSRLIAGQLHEVSAHDPLVFTISPLTIALIAMVAITVPANRAMSRDVPGALRAR